MMQTWPNFGFTVAYVGSGGSLSLTPVAGAIAFTGYAPTVASGTGVITVDVQAARTTGVAPLYVNFDASATTHSLITRPAFDCLFKHTFEDSGSGTWDKGIVGNGSDSRNIGYGAWYGHVYNGAGTYTSSVDVLDPLGNTGNATATPVVVSDPNLFYAGTQTVCFSRDTDFTGCPSDPLTTKIPNCAADMTALFNAHKGANKRLMWHRGQSWETTGILVAENGSTLTSFGPGSRVTITNKSVSAGITLQSNLDDVRIFAIDIPADPATSAPDSAGVTNNGPLSRVLLMDMEFLGYRNGGPVVVHGGNGITQHDTCDQFATINITTGNRLESGVSGIGMFLSMTRGSVMGCDLDNGGMAEHTMRFPFLYKSNVCHNTFKRPNAAKAVLKIHGFNMDSWNVRDGEFVVSDNIIDNRGGKNGISNLCEYGTGDAADREVTGSAIFERNIGYSKVDSTTGQTMFGIASPGCVVRNNLFMAMVGTPVNKYQNVTFFATNSGIVGNETTGTEVYNNTMFTNAWADYDFAPAGAYQMVTMVNVLDRTGSIAPGGTDTFYGTLVARNNLHYSTTATVNAPNAASVLNQSSTAVITQSNNTSNVAGVDYRANPNFTATPPAAYSDWKPTYGYAVNGGTSAPVVKDFLNVTRTGTFDIGAIQP